MCVCTRTRVYTPVCNASAQRMIGHSQVSMHITTIIIEI